MISNRATSIFSETSLTLAVSTILLYICHTMPKNEAWQRASCSETKTSEAMPGTRANPTFSFCVGVKIRRKSVDGGDIGKGQI